MQYFTQKDHGQILLRSNHVLNLQGVFNVVVPFVIVAIGLTQGKYRSVQGALIAMLIQHTEVTVFQKLRRSHTTLVYRNVMIGDSMFVAPASLTDYRIACCTSTEMKDLICFITVCCRLGLNCATSATLMNASLNDGRIKHRTEKTTLNVSYLLKSIDAWDDKERRAVLKKFISEVQSFFEKVYPRHKQTTIRFADPITVADAPNPKPTTPPPTPPSALRHSTTVAATPPQNSVASLPRPASAGLAPSHASTNPCKHGAAQSGAITTTMQGTTIQDKIITTRRLKKTRRVGD
jgi:hypothetical protein